MDSMTCQYIRSIIQTILEETEKYQLIVSYDSGDERQDYYNRATYSIEKKLESEHVDVKSSQSIKKL